jgi:hypothetical protein
MAKRTRTTIIRDNPDDDVNERGDLAAREIEQDSGEQAFSEFMTKNRGVEGCRVRIRRQTPQGRQFCIAEPPEAIENIEEYLASYHARQLWATEEGVYFVSVDVHGETRSAFTIRIAPATHTAQAPMSGGMAVAGDVNTRILERIEQRLSMPQEKPPILDMIDGMAKIDQMRGGANGGMNLDSMVKLIEIGSRLNGVGGSGESGGWEGLARDVLKDNAPGIIALLQMGVQKLGAMGKPAEQPAAEPGKVEDTMQPSEQETAILQQAIGFLKKKAAAHSDPGLYVDLIVDNREDPLYARLISKIVENDFSAFATLDPDIGKPEYRDFFGFIHNRIRQVFKPANTVATTGGGKHGNKGNASGNGTTGKSGGQ